MSQAVIPNPLYVLLEGGQYLTIGNAVSMVGVNDDYDDDSTYRNIIDASILGNPHSIVTVKPSKSDAQTLASEPSLTPPTTPAGPSGASSSSLSISYSASIEPAVINGALTTSAPSVQTDAKFLVGASDLIPGQTMKTMSIMQFWSAASGTGSLVGEVILDEIRSLSGTAPFNLN